MQWLEANPLPDVCRSYQADCYNCDHALGRWHLSEKEDLLLRRKGLIKAIARLQQQVDEIDELLNWGTP